MSLLLSSFHRFCLSLLLSFSASSHKFSGRIFLAEDLVSLEINQSLEVDFCKRLSISQAEEAVIDGGGDNRFGHVKLGIRTLTSSIDLT